MALLDDNWNPYQDDFEWMDGPIVYPWDVMGTCKYCGNIHGQYQKLDDEEWFACANGHATELVEEY